uniref:Regulator of G-protein signaling 1 n=1 Tax=Echeneis naucrates TaxID=173247 RepID=A0A665SWV8_ECHNA
MPCELGRKKEHYSFIFIHYSSTAYRFRVTGVAGANHSSRWARAGYTLERSPVHHRANTETDRDQQPLTLRPTCYHPLHAAGKLVFEDFLRTEYSEENLLFWLACEDYKKITSMTEREAGAKKIYTEFVQVDALKQINIDCVTREEISENISQPGPNCFDRAQRLIYRLMENDCYPRFLKSEIYQALLEQAEQQ